MTLTVFNTVSYSRTDVSKPTNKKLELLSYRALVKIRQSKLVALVSIPDNTLLASDHPSLREKL